jgi:uncharacterized membrane protein
MKNCVMIGRVFFAISMIASGLQQFIRQDFVRLVPKLPSWVPVSSIWAVLSGILLVAAGLAILFERKRVPAAILLGALFLVVFLLHIPGVFANPSAGYMWTNPCKTLALLGASLLLAALPGEPNPAQPPSSASPLDGALRLSAVLFGLFFVVGGIQHFIYVDFVTQLVPTWIPVPRFWAYFTGVALVAGGIGMNFRFTASSAAVSSGIMVFLWVLLLHIPRALAASHDPGETSAIFEALALSGTAFLIGGVGEQARLRQVSHKRLDDVNERVL